MEQKPSFMLSLIQYCQKSVIMFGGKVEEYFTTVIEST